MKILNLLVIGLFSLALMLSCNTRTPAEGVQVLACQDFDTKLKETENAQLIDVRTAEEYAGGTIGAAVNIDYYADDFKEQMARLDKTKPVFVFCAKGGRSGEASAICSELGFNVVYDLEGGYTAWTAYQPK